jgi:hypothetical protein
MTGLAGAATVIARDEAPPPFDLHCPLGSLPLALKTERATVPAQIPYLAADEAQVAKWSACLGELPRPRIALAWSGNPNHDNDHNRSIPFAKLAPLLLNPPPLAGEGREGASGQGATFISIQRDIRSEDAASLAAESHVIHIGDALMDFSDTAAVLASCDLVITVDTAVAHLAGVMGRPVWVLIPFAPDWRWGLEGEATPWYPTARLFRQTVPGDWDNVLTRVAAALARLPSLA